MSTREESKEKRKRERQDEAGLGRVALDERRSTLNRVVRGRDRGGERGRVERSTLFAERSR